LTHQIGGVFDAGVSFRTHTFVYGRPKHKSALSSKILMMKINHYAIFYCPIPQGKCHLLHVFGDVKKKEGGGLNYKSEGMKAPRNK